MTVISTEIVSDTLQGAIELSIFDFFACFAVLYLISLIIKCITYLDERIPVQKSDRKVNG